ncbi:hypothetical protein ANN_27570 [Periplaneta americana]|uniref:Uncharacterized protein n=1 Tax=Periplaneta americana TaxID=6978 RepID=A0ABQ8RWB1_PERAM|nr:hypothetical protein ANN_27570 [Periplaneta americana]
MYKDIFQQFGTLTELGKDTEVYDWKKYTKLTKIPGQWHFKFNEAKRMILTREKGILKIRGEPFYRSDLGFANFVFKRGNNIDKVKPEILPLRVPVKREKCFDIDSMLKLISEMNGRNKVTLNSMGKWLIMQQIVSHY